MPRHVTEVKIARPPREVFDFVTDLERVPEWVWFTKEMLTVEGKGKGCRYTERGPLGKSSWRVTKATPGKLEVHEGKVGPGVVKLTLEVIPRSKGSLFRQTVDYQAFPNFRPLGWVVENTVMRAVMSYGMKRTTPNAKAILEAGPTVL